MTTEDVGTKPILCANCGRHLIPAEEFLGHFWRHEATRYRACDPATHQGPWAIPIEPGEVQS